MAKKLVGFYDKDVKPDKIVEDIEKKKQEMEHENLLDGGFKVIGIFDGDTPDEEVEAVIEKSIRERRG